MSAMLSYSNFINKRELSPHSLFSPKGQGRFKMPSHMLDNARHPVISHAGRTQHTQSAHNLTLVKIRNMYEGKVSQGGLGKLTADFHRQARLAPITAQNMNQGLFFLHQPEYLLHHPAILKLRLLGQAGGEFRVNLIAI